MGIGDWGLGIGDWAQSPMDMFHPPRRNNRQTLAVRNIVICTQGVLNTVTRPSALAVSECQNTVATIRTSEHHFRTRLVILRVLNTLASVRHKATQHRLAETVVEERGVLHEILLHGVVHRVRNTRRSLFPADRERICRIQERNGREQVPIHITDFVIRLRSGNNSAAVVLTSCSR